MLLVHASLWVMFQTRQLCVTTSPTTAAQSRTSTSSSPSFSDAVPSITDSTSSSLAPSFRLSLSSPSFSPRTPARRFPSVRLSYPVLQYRYTAGKYKRNASRDRLSTDVQFVLQILLQSRKELPFKANYNAYW